MIPAVAPLALPRLLSVRQAAAAMAISASMVRKLVRKGLPAVRVGKRLLLCESDIAGFIEGHRTSSGQVVNIGRGGR
jgi:excisionase family DNA binding protein